MALQEDFNQIIDYAHFWNWAPDWGEVQRIYEKFPDLRTYALCVFLFGRTD